jgi:hypothetical protein
MSQKHENQLKNLQQQKLPEEYHLSEEFFRNCAKKVRLI